MQTPKVNSHPAPVGARALVVDDNRVNRALLASRLKNMGLRVITAEGGQEALDTLKAHHADLVLLDIEMPGLSGFEVLTRIRERFTRAQLPVVMVTAREDEGDIVRALSEGANDYIFKKSDFAVIRARVEGQLALKRALDQFHESRSMESISIVTGGIAHEINTPLQYINDNASFIDQA
ncbi:MAG: response regulator, partial [Deltaproteobacteria bacterium]|nr:response regulator [Deltaproteobacteria bacterium]